MKKNIVILLSIVLGVFVFLIMFSKYTDRNFRKVNGFNRNFSKVKVEIRNTINFYNEDHTFIDFTPTKFSLYKFRKPDHLIEYSQDLQDHHESRINIASPITRTQGANSVTILNGKKFLLIGRSGKAYRIAPDQTMDSTILNPGFGQSIALDSNLFVITTSFFEKGAEIRNIKLVDWKGKTINKYMPEKQIDGLFCTDGQFRYDHSNEKLVYMFYYRGEFACLDKNLKIKYRAKTIDTVTKAKLSLKKNPNGSFFYAAPPHLVNRSTFIQGGKIFILSNLKADNESQDDFKNSEVIDVYALKNGKYLYSFYLPLLGKQKLYDFGVYNQTLIATYRNAISAFKIP